jgi:hypothetical protein
MQRQSNSLKFTSARSISESQHMYEEMSNKIVLNFDDLQESQWNYFFQVPLWTNTSGFAAVISQVRGTPADWTYLDIRNAMVFKAASEPELLFVSWLHVNFLKCSCHEFLLVEPAIAPFPPLAASDETFSGRGKVKPSPMVLSTTELQHPTRHSWGCSSENTSGGKFTDLSTRERERKQLRKRTYPC